MATNDAILKSFLVSVGFVTDQTGLKNLLGNLASTESKLATVAKGIGAFVSALATVGVAAEVMVTRFAAHMERLHYTSKRTGASIKMIESMGFAFSKMGLDSEDAASSLESFASAMRMNPVQRSLVDGMLGRKTAAEEQGRVMLDVIKKVKSQMPHWAAAQRMQAWFGMDEKTYLMISTQQGKMNENIKKRNALLKAYGLTEKEVAKSGFGGVAYMDRLRDIGINFSVLGDKISIKLMPLFQWLTDSAEKLAIRMSKWISSLTQADLEGVKRTLMGMWENLKLITNETLTWVKTLKEADIKGWSNDTVIALSYVITALSSMKRLVSAISIGVQSAAIAVKGGLLTDDGREAVRKLGEQLKAEYAAPEVGAEIRARMRIGSTVEAITAAERAAMHPRASASSPPPAGAPVTAVPAGTVGSKSSQKRITKESQELFARLEKEYGLPAGMLDRLWHQESVRGKAMLSPAGAQGHFQFMPKTAVQYGVSDPNDLTQSATGAAKYMRKLLKQFGGNVALADAAYNWGEGNVSRNLKNGVLMRAPAETIGHVRGVTGQDLVGQTIGGGVTQNVSIIIDGAKSPRDVAEETMQRIQAAQAEALRNARSKN
jgi:soluble lytic murein transglycosylase-like protein